MYRQSWEVLVYGHIVTIVVIFVPRGGGEECLAGHLFCREGTGAVYDVKVCSAKFLRLTKEMSFCVSRKIK